MKQLSIVGPIWLFECFCKNLSYEYSCNLILGFWVSVCRGVCVYRAPRWPCGASAAARPDTPEAQLRCPGTCWASPVSTNKKEKLLRHFMTKHRSMFLFSLLGTPTNLWVTKPRWVKCVYLLWETGASHSVCVSEGRSFMQSSGQLESLS